MNNESVGLTHSGALNRLADDLLSRIPKSSSHSKLCGLRDVAESLAHGGSGRSIYCWVYLVCTLLVTVLMFVEVFLSDYKSARIASLLVLLLVTGFNVYLTSYLHSLAKTEIYRKLENVCRLIRNAQYCNAAQFITPDLAQPQSECIHLQWVYRDKKLVNLPWNLLVQGDVILLRPGRETPCKCVYVNSKGQETIYYSGSLYTDEPKMDSKTGGVIPLKPLKCTLLETPSVKYVDTCLKTPRRPESLFEREMFRVLHVHLERRGLPIAFFISFLGLCLRYLVFFFKGNMFISDWSEDIVQHGCCIILPLVNPCLPIFMYTVHTVSLAYIICKYKSTVLPPSNTSGELRRESECKQDPEQFSYCSAFSDEDESTDHSSLISANKQEIKSMTHRLKNVIRTFFELIKGDPTHLPLTSNLLHALGSVSSVSVVDKKGILSWPNPTPEKVFFFRRAETSDHIKKHTKTHLSNSDSKQEVLDLTHDPDRAFHVHFDDSSWYRYMSHLKPLALNMQLNSCYLDNDYLRLMDHVHVVARSVPHTVGVVNRRCCCYLAKLIGLKQKSGVSKKKLSQRFDTQCLGAYRRQSCEVASLPGMTKHRTPLANIFSVIVPDSSIVNPTRSTIQVQGTADLMIDMCTHAWLGDQLVQMSKTHRKKANDFYHRNSMTAYCVAYGFKALSGVNKIDHALERVFIDWPRHHISQTSPYQRNSKRIRTKSENVMDSPCANFTAPLPRQIPSISCDSGLGVELKDPHMVNTVQECLDTVLSNHVFLGMIALQYQAKPDVVRLIEQLDKACIRFVYFSKENELRSRVFAEKMGLEAGWNCHISLASEGSANNVTETTGRRMSFVSESRMRRTRRYSLPSDLRVFDSKSHLRPSNKGRASRLGSLSPPPLLENLALKPLTSVELLLEENENTSLSSVSSTSTSESSVFADLGLIKSTAPCVQMESVDLSDEFKPTRKYSRINETLNEAHRSLSNDESLDMASTVSATESTGNAASAHYWMLHNRSQLPKGIKQVRPHLETVDNVPLLVSLFTDTDHVTTRQMVEIMQDYGEVVMVIGSTLNYHNADIFSQADSSIALEPLTPTSCVNKGVDRSLGQGTATHLAAMITSIPCSLTFHSGQHINLLTLLEMARHFLGVTRSALILILSLSLFLSCIQSLALVFMLPAPFSTSQLLLWLFVSLPLLACSVCFSRRDSGQTLRMATPKRTNLVAPKVVKRYVFGFLVKFLPSVFMINLVFCVSLLSVCKRNPFPTSACVWWTSHLSNMTLSPYWDGNSSSVKMLSRDAVLSMTRYTTSVLITIYMCILSSGFVAYWQSFLSHPPFRNKIWCLSCILVVMIQILFLFISSSLDDKIYLELQSLSFIDVKRIPWIPLIVGLVWCIPLVLINEAWKLRECKLYRRDQRRRRLSFGTKLGMNSPW